ncbi:MAG: hypothetical protein CVU46_01385 [Chloroflexi bacterium HGW-Chloroflexi-8]|nr:MAG: hypothetical protein CVU46_01385 [Chloroflexi bacterium HGW-Chloroflexi-8]
MKNQKQKSTSLLSGALILLVLSIFFLGIWTGLFAVHNWWAIIFWIPAISSITNLFQEIKRKNGFSFAIVSSISGILFPIAISFGFFMNVDWQQFTPLLIIIAGLILFQTGFLNSDEPIGKMAANFRSWIFSTGLAVITTGILFIVSLVLSKNNQNLSLSWFGIPFMICALGGFFFVVKSNAQTERSNLFVIVNLLTALIFFTIGFLAFAGLKLNFWGGAITFALYVLLSIVVIQIRK